VRTLRAEIHRVRYHAAQWQAGILLSLQREARHPFSAAGPKTRMALSRSRSSGKISKASSRTPPRSLSNFSSLWADNKRNRQRLERFEAALSGNQVERDKIPGLFRKRPDRRRRPRAADGPELTGRKPGCGPTSRSFQRSCAGWPMLPPSSNPRWRCSKSSGADSPGASEGSEAPVGGGTGQRD
jgi:hypothetical protein